MTNSDFTIETGPTTIRVGCNGVGIYVGDRLKVIMPFEVAVALSKELPKQLKEYGIS